MKNLFLTVLGAALFLGACNGNTESTRAASAGVPSEASAEAQTEEPSTTVANTDEKPVRAKIRVVLRGGEMAGTYEALCKDGGCSHGLAGEGKFGLQYSETGKGEKELSSVQMIVPGVNGDTKTKEFMMTISFGELFEGQSYTINTLRESSNQQGSGTMDITYSGKKATVNMEGKTAEGYGVELSLECMKVLTPDNMMEELSGK